MVCAAIAIWVNSGFGLISAPSGWKWCSVSQNDWNPSFSARMPWRTWLTSTSCAAACTSASEPSFTATPSLVSDHRKTGRAIMEDADLEHCIPSTDFLVVAEATG